MFETLGPPESHLPKLEYGSYRVTSGETNQYNCIAWAVGDTGDWWSPLVDAGHYWPIESPQRATLEVVRAAFEHEGFEACEDGRLVHGVEKIALFADEKTWTHVARQLESGGWTSKLGSDCDIEHELEALEGFDDSPDAYRYGRVVGFMSRPRSPDQRAV